MNVGHFASLETIEVDNPLSWQGKTFLTFDIDWANDAVLADAIEIIEKAAVPATWFVTHSTPLIKRLRSNPNFTLGIHPNFNDLLAGQAEGNRTHAKEIVLNLLELIPEAKVLRSHSLVQSERLVDLFHACGITHISNFFIPEEAGPQRPWHLWDGMVCTPHVWQDNVSMRLNGVVSPPKGGKGLQIYDFHPIHVFLNTERVERYESARPFFQQPDTLRNHRLKNGLGTRDVLLGLLESP
ncbi:hypothetical protein MCEMIEM13_00272 [Comamonadaceae bacterium]